MASDLMNELALDLKESNNSIDGEYLNDNELNFM
jgi:hypothetical protein